MSEIYKNLGLNNLEGEEWRDIPNYEGLYQVSNMGRVKSLRDNNGKPREKILQQNLNHIYGYLYVNLCKEGKRKYNLVHRLVANIFLENPNNFRCVNHKDEDKTNNCVDNLEWCDVAYNNIYGNRLKKVAEKLTNRQDLSKQVYQYDKNGTLVGIWQSTAEAGRNGFDCGNVSSCCLGKLKHYKGYIWRYTPL